MNIIFSHTCFGFTRTGYAHLKKTLKSELVASLSSKIPQAAQQSQKLNKQKSQL